MWACRFCSASAPSHSAMSSRIRAATRSPSHRPRKRNTPAECDAFMATQYVPVIWPPPFFLLYESYELRPVIEPGLSAELFPDGQRRALAHLAKAVAPTRPLRRPSQLALDLRIRDA